MRIDPLKEDFMLYVDARITKWAEWFMRGNWYGIGYPTCSVEFRMMTEGCILQNRNGPGQLLCNEEAEEIERLVKQMAKQNPKMALALRCHYLNRGGLRIKAKLVEMSHMQFKNYVDMARYWLAGCLSNKKIIKRKMSCTVNTNRV